VLEDAVMPAVDYRLADGLSWEQRSGVLGGAIANPRALGLEVTIFNPALDASGKIARNLVDCLVAGLLRGPPLLSPQP
jgi:arginase